MADVHRSCLARLLDGDPCRIDRDQSRPTIRRLRARSTRPRTLCTDLLGNRTGARISLGQRQLAAERGLDALRQRQPLFARRRFEAAQ